MTDRSHLRPWVRWFCERHMTFVPKAVLILCFPVILAAYLPDAARDVRIAWRDIK